MGLLARIRRALAGSSDPELVMREQYREFQGLLEANDAALERIAALSELLSRMEPFTAAAVAGLVEEILVPGLPDRAPAATAAKTSTPA